MCITALANLQHSSQKDNRASSTMFSLQRDVIPFLEQNWEALTTAARRSTQSWHTTVRLLTHLFPFLSYLPELGNAIYFIKVIMS